MLVAYSRALLSGMVALAVNFLLLRLADRLGIVTARGGFQLLVKLWTGPVLRGLGVDRAWAALHLPDPNGALFTNGFKVAVGLAMAVIYVSIRPLQPGSTLEKGLIYALLVWAINATVVLPALGQGFRGHQHTHRHRHSRFRGRPYRLLPGAGGAELESKVRHSAVPKFNERAWTTSDMWRPIEVRCWRKAEGCRGTPAAT